MTRFDQKYKIICIHNSVKPDEAGGTPGFLKMLLSGECVSVCVRACVCACMCVCPCPQAMKNLNNQSNKSYCFSVSLYDTCDNADGAWP